MNPLLAHLDRIEAARDALLAEVAEVAASDPDRLRHRPGSGSWCVLEVVEHLVLAERSVLRGLFDPERLEARQRTPRDRALRWVVRGILRFGIPVKAPSRSMVPGGEIELPELQAMWEENHRRLRAFLTDLEAEAEEDAVFRHPVTGPLPPAAAVDLMAVHLDRHRGQIAQLLARRTA